MTPPKPKHLCIYHGGCNDGFGAAMVTMMYFDRRHVDLYAAAYHKSVLNEVNDKYKVDGRKVYMVDFSYDYAVMSSIASQCSRLVVLDHHVSRKDDLARLQMDFKDKVHVEFDTERCGTTLAWDYFFKNERRPEVVAYIEDRDLWRKQYKHTELVHYALDSVPKTYEDWHPFFNDPSSVGTLINEGKAIRRYLVSKMQQMIKDVALVELDGYTVPILNAPIFMASNLGEILCDGHPFAIAYQVSSEGIKCSLRSNENGADVAKVAARYGGGGHTRAAGMFLRSEEINDIIPKVKK